MQGVLTMDDCMKVLLRRYGKVEDQNLTILFGKVCPWVINQHAYREYAMSLFPQRLLPGFELAEAPERSLVSAAGGKRTA